MIKMFLALFGAGFVVFSAGMAIAPNLVLGAYQNDFVDAWTKAGVDTSSCQNSVPSLGIGAHECYEGSIKDIARQLNEANEDQASFDFEHDEHE